MPRFFISKSFINNESAVISGGDAGHISNVLRMKAGDKLLVCDGEGFDYDAEIFDISKNQINVKLINKKRCDTEPDIKIVLFQSLVKQGKMEHIIQKCTELGVFEVVPVHSKRCIAKPADKLTRWRKIAYEAAKQSGRGIIPIIRETVTFSDAVTQMGRTETAIMPYEKERVKCLRDVLQNGSASEISLLIGPEGGFEPDEVALAHEKQVHIVTLGKRILRTETAAAAVIPIIMYAQRQI